MDPNAQNRRQKHEAPRGERRRVSRRRFLKLTAGASVGLALAACAPPPAPSASPGGGEAQPAQEAKSIHMLQWSSFIAAMDELLIQQASQWGADNGVEVTVERIAVNDIPARLASAVQAQSGPDIIQMWDNWAWLYEDNLVDVSAEASALESEQGGFYDDMKAYCNVNGTWRAIPYAFVPNAFPYRTDYFQEGLGHTNWPDTTEEFIETGAALMDAGQPGFGIAFGHSFGDPPSFWYPWLWSHGGHEVNEDATEVTLNSPETVAAVESAVRLFNEGFVPGTLSWDDSSNNRAYLAGQVSSTINGASIYFVAKRDFPDIAEVTNHGLHLAGPAGRYSYQFNWSNGVMAYSNAAEPAKEFISWLMQPEQYGPWLEAGEGYDVGVLHAYDDHPVWQKDPKILAYRDAVIQGTGRWPGWPGPPIASAARVRNDYIIVDLFAKACSGEFTPEQAAEWAAGQVARRYGL